MEKFEYENKQKILVDDGLYSEYETEIFDIEKLGKFFFTGTIDVYCGKCQKETSFKISGPESYKFTDEVKLLIKDPCLITVRAKCTRQEESGYYNSCNGEYVGLFSLSNKTLIKIGQMPSKADIDFGKLDKAFELLDKEDRKELGKGIGLYSHGIGIGSFVYLRRIFERIIEDAHKEAKKSDKWDEESYYKCRMNEKIVLLKEYLPTKLVKTANLYSVLSLGIHELSEEVCMREFPKIKQAIQLILNEKYEDKEYEKIVSSITITP